MKDSSLLSSSYGSQDTMQRSVSVLNLMEVVMANINSPSIGNGTRDYFCALCQQSFPSPLVDGSVGSKENVHKKVNCGDLHLFLLHNLVISFMLIL